MLGSRTLALALILALSSCVVRGQSVAPATAQSSADVPPAPAPPADETFDGTTRALAVRDLTSPELARRAAAIQRMGMLGRPEDLARIVRFLDAEEETLRTTAARALVAAGETTAMARFTERAADRRASVRLEALVILREAPTLPAAARRAAERALGDADAAPRLAALELLTAHPGAESVPMVSGALADGNHEVRLAAIRLLGLSRDGRALLPLLHRIDVADRGDRTAVIDAIGAVGARPPLDPGPALLRQLEDTNEDVRRAAVDALGKVRHAGAVAALERLARRPARDLLARRASLALGAIGGEPAVRVLVELLREAAPLEEVALSLRRVGRVAIEPVAAILSDGLPGSARAAADILGAIGDSAATTALAATLRTRPAVGIPVARALGALGDPATASALLGALGDPRYAAAPGVREACLRALGALSVPATAIDANARRLIDAAARDADSDVRVAALDLAGSVHGGLSRATLEAALRAPDAMVRLAALRAAAVMPTLEPTPLLLAALASAPVTGAGASPTATAVRGSAHEEQQLVEAAADALERVAQTGDRPRLNEALARVPVGRRPAVERALQAVERRQAQTAWLRVRLRRPDGSPLAGRAFTLSAGRGAGTRGTLRARTDDAGEALLTALPGPEPYVLSVDSAAQVARTEATLSGKSPAMTPELPRARDASVPAQP